MIAKANAVPLLSERQCLQFDRNILGQLSQQKPVFPQSLDAKKKCQMKPHKSFYEMFGTAVICQLN